MTSVGETLRRERIRRGVDLAQLARNTRINLKYLEAIEADNTSGIPGGFFYRSFVRQYALALGFEAKELEAVLDRVREDEAPALTAALQTAAFPLKAPDPIVQATNKRIAAGRLSAYIVLLVGVVTGCSAFYSWWHRLDNQPVSTATIDAPASAPPASPKVVPVKNTTAQTPDGQRAVSVDISQAGADDRVVISLAAREATWLSITSDGKSVFAGILAPNQTKVLGGKDRAYLRVGNAGGLEIIWNGKSIGPIGERGQVKTVLFTPETFQIQPAGSL